MKKLSTLILALIGFGASAQTDIIYECGENLSEGFKGWHILNTSSSGTYSNLFQDHQADSTLDIFVASDGTVDEHVYVFKNIPEIGVYADLTFTYEAYPNHVSDAFNIWIGDSSATNLPMFNDAGWDLIGTDPQDSQFYNNYNGFTKIFLGFNYSPEDTVSFQFDLFRIEADTTQFVGMVESVLDDVSINFDQQQLLIGNAPDLEYTVNIYDLSGKTVLIREGRGEMRFSTPLNSGVYIVSLTCGEATKNKQFFINL